MSQTCMLEGIVPMSSLAGQKHQGTCYSEHFLQEQLQHFFRDRLDYSSNAFRTLQSISVDPLSSSSQRYYQPDRLVRLRVKPDRSTCLLKCWFSSRRTSSRRLLPHRTVRRVHVVPWATPIRRIGCSRRGFFGQEGDDPASFGRRREFTLAV